MSMSVAGRTAIASFRFYAQLNDFVPPERRGRSFVHAVQDRSSVKDAIESLGVPHPEVELILVNGTPAGFGQHLHDGDAVAVYPRFASLDLGDLPRVGACVPHPLRFLADIHLRKLASYLRLAGFDVIVFEDDGDGAREAAASERVVLTRDRELLKRNAVRAGRWVRETDPYRQFVEIIDRFDLASHARPFTRCLRCNGELQPVAREAVASRLPPRTRVSFSDFRRCPSCGRVYWRGSHYERLERLLQKAFEVADPAGVRAGSRPEG